MSRCISCCSRLAAVPTPGISSMERARTPMKRIIVLLYCDLPYYPILLTDREMSATIPLPAAFIGLCADRALLSVADGFEPFCRNSQLRQKVTCGCGAAVA